MDLGPSASVCHSSIDRALHYDLKAVRPHFTGKVVGVADGDSITVIQQGRGERIRLLPSFAMGEVAAYEKQTRDKSQSTGLFIKSSRNLSWRFRDFANSCRSGAEPLPDGAGEKAENTSVWRGSKWVQTILNQAW